MNTISFVMRWCTTNIIKPVFGSLVVYDLFLIVLFIALRVAVIMLIIAIKKKNKIISLKNKQIENLSNKLKKRFKQK